MKRHLLVIYSLIFVSLTISFFNLSERDNNDTSEIKNKVDKVEFYQEGTRIMNNLVGFDQVHNSLSSQEQKLHCTENRVLLDEWGEDLTGLQNLNTEFVSSDQDAKEFVTSAQSLYDEVNRYCSN